MRQNKGFVNLRVTLFFHGIPSSLAEAANKQIEINSTSYTPAAYALRAV